MAKESAYDNWKASAARLREVETCAGIVRIFSHLGLPARAPLRAPAQPLALFQAA